ncbi:MAG TPA: hypothetical protein VFE66_07465, partial [Bacteroidales bacterium]|nr:hypothetical protein [Bacteroidales bacterium]
MKQPLARPAGYVLLPVLLFLFSQVAGAQKITRFSGDSTKFITELNSVFAPLVANNEEKMSSTLMKAFIQKWN